MKIRGIVHQPDDRYTIEYVDDDGIIHMAYDCSVSLDYVSAQQPGAVIRCVFITCKDVLGETEI